MIRTTILVRVALVLASFGVCLSTLAPAPADAQDQNMEVIHHPNYDKNVFMPFVPAIKIKSGKLLWLAGTTALPVYHDHPHKREEIQQYMVNDSKPRRGGDGRDQTDTGSLGRLFQGRRALLRLFGRVRAWATSERRAR